MKDIKCPLCKEKLEQFNVLRDGTLVEVGCHKCKWSTHPNSPEEAWKEVEEFISLFPPFMRVNQGDNIKLDFEDDILTVIGKDTDRGKLYLENCRGDVEIATSDDVEEWPWEIEQKGGQQ